MSEIIEVIDRLMQGEHPEKLASEYSADVVNDAIERLEQRV